MFRILSGYNNVAINTWLYNQMICMIERSVFCCMLLSDTGRVETCLHGDEMRREDADPKLPEAKYNLRTVLT